MKNYMHMNDKQIDELISKALNEEQALPEGLSERLEQYIDMLSADEQQTKRRSLFRRRSLYWFSGVAAALVVAIAVFFQTESSMPHEQVTADTFTDPEEAAIVAQNALAFMSLQLNKGLEQVAEAGQEMQKVNQILDKSFNR